MKKVCSIILISLKVLITMFLLFAVYKAQASPQIYPSGIQYMGTGNLSVTISVYNPDQATVDTELVLVKDLRQRPDKDISIKGVTLNARGETRIPITFDIKDNPKPFWLCVKTFQGIQPVRDCSTITQRKMK